MEKSKELLIESLRKKDFSESIISAFEKVKRENFVPEHLKSYAYEDIALPIESGSTISQPSTIAFMLSLLDLHYGQKVLEIGSGSGYVTSLISEIIKSGKVYGLEINKRLAIKSKELLLKDSNIEIFNKSGSLGFSSLAPFDRIIVSASFSDLRIPLSLSEQLSQNGLLIAPIKSSIFKIIKNSDGKLIKEEFQGFVFVPFREE